MSDKLHQADETIDIFDTLVRERDELRDENERLRAAAMKLDGYWINDTYDPGTRNVSVRESAFAELRDLLGLKPKTYD